MELIRLSSLAYMIIMKSLLAHEREKLNLSQVAVYGLRYGVSYFCQDRFNWSQLNGKEYHAPSSRFYAVNHE